MIFFLFLLSLPKRLRSHHCFPYLGTLPRLFLHTLPLLPQGLASGLLRCRLHDRLPFLHPGRVYLHFPQNHRYYNCRPRLQFPRRHHHFAARPLLREVH